MNVKAQGLYNAVSFTLLATIAVALVAMSSHTRQGAMDGLALAENTIIPSLLPLLIIFLTIMRSGASRVLARIFGRLTTALFNLPANASSAVIFGLVGGYPAGALMTEELLRNDDIDAEQARRLLRFCFCGGCGFIITAVGAVAVGSAKTGLLLFCSNVLSSVVIGVVLSFTQKRIKYEPFSFCESLSFGDALSSATSSAIDSVLNITAYIVVFSAIKEILPIPDYLMSLLEITNGVCSTSLPLPILSAYLAFGGICIHFQLIPIISDARMKYCDFFIFRVFAALLSYGITKGLLVFFPVDKMVFASSSDKLVSLFSVNITLSVLMVIGCFVLVLDISSRKEKAV